MGISGYSQPGIQVLYVISIQKIQDIYSLLPEILMNKEFCDLTRSEHILVYELNLCVLRWCIVYPGSPQDYPKGSRTSPEEILAWLGMPVHTQPKQVVSDATYP